MSALTAAHPVLKLKKNQDRRVRGGHPVHRDWR